MYKLEKQTQMIKDKREYIIIELICINFNKLVYIELSVFNEWKMDHIIIKIFE